MAPTTPVRRAWRALTGLLVLTAVLFGANALGVWGFKESSWTPELALDLQGGTQIILEAQTEGADPSAEQMEQAVEIIRQRVDASGVSEASVTTQGGRNVVVEMPGEIDEETRNRIESSAQLELREVIASTGAATSYVGEDGESTEFPSPDPDLPTTPAAEPTAPNDPNQVSEADAARFNAYDCTAPDQNPAEAADDKAMIACDPTNQVKYLLGPVDLTGDSLTDASSGQNPNNGQWEVYLRFDDEGTDVFSDVSKRLYAAQSQQAPDMAQYGMPTAVSGQTQFSFVLDGVVISAPEMNAVITDGRPSISGTFDQESAQTLADQLKFGALPLSFEVVSSDTISATLGEQQLMIGLIAGLIGLGLVAVYVLIQYRLLGTVIIASLIVMGVLTYLLLCLLSWRLGYRLSLAGVAGLIVTIGFTADSFIVYFERIRDELRDGKAVTVAVEDGWDRAKRTIYISKSINILAAVVLYILADATVKGFAFTLGITTALDILIFVMFTHPVMELLSRTRFFGGGHKLSGLDPQGLGAVYRGRAQFRKPVGASSSVQKSRGEAARRQTIAERKQAEAEAAAMQGAGTNKEGDR
ncbi:protein translocase subunit SecD [Microbacterium halophytorum]|uniref:protein translocase subunit SecD n=1 Tax=Microbacterium halophytorum TaxID=2067568 RepID=UPI000CFE0FFC|nr:protein translocase subunit SecD [Microbacterium halophytorum]